MQNDQFETGAALFEACLAFDFKDKEKEGDDDDDGDDSASTSDRAAYLRDMYDACVYLFRARRLRDLDLACEIRGGGGCAHRRPRGTSSGAGEGEDKRSWSRPGTPEDPSRLHVRYAPLRPH